MKRKIFSYLIITLLTVFYISQMTACNTSNGESNETIIELSPLYPHYQDEQSLIVAASDIIYGEVIKVHPAEEIDDSGGNSNIKHVYTVSDIKVEKAIKGKLSKDDVIQVKQLGGKFNNVNYVVSSSIDYFQKGSEHLLFLKGYEGDIPYCTLNIVQSDIEFINGKAKINDDGLFKSYTDKSDIINNISSAVTSKKE